MDTALPQKFPFILDRNLTKANYSGNRVCTSCDIVVFGLWLLWMRILSIFTLIYILTNSDEDKQTHCFQWEWLQWHRLSLKACVFLYQNRSEQKNRQILHPYSNHSHKLPSSVGSDAFTVFFWRNGGYTSKNKSLICYKSNITQNALFFRRSFWKYDFLAITEGR